MLFENSGCERRRSNWRRTAAGSGAEFCCPKSWMGFGPTGKQTPLALRIIRPRPGLVQNVLNEINPHRYMHLAAIDPVGTRWNLSNRGGRPYICFRSRRCTYGWSLRSGEIWFTGLSGGVFSCDCGSSPLRLTRPGHHPGRSNRGALFLLSR